MSLASSTYLAPHFTAGELGADNPSIPATALSGVRYTLAPGLERLRTVLGVPMQVTSGYRTPEHNAAVNGSPTSDHPNGLAADFIPVGLSLFDAWSKLKDASDRIGRFDQLIYYPADGHIHVGYGPRMRGESLIKIGENYDFLTDSMAEKLTGFVADATQVASTVKSTVSDAVDQISQDTGASTTTIVAILAAIGVLLLWGIFS